MPDNDEQHQPARRRDPVGGGGTRRHARRRQLPGARHALRHLPTACLREETRLLRKFVAHWRRVIS